MTARSIAMKFTTALFVLFGIACAHFVPRTACAPRLGDNGSEVLQACGKPKHMGSITTSYGAVREEFEYRDLDVLLEDNIVIHVVKFTPSLERPL
jgi:hypothetical protein